MNSTTTTKKLTPAQSDFAAEHYHLIDEFLRIKGYPSDDFFDVVVFGFLRAVRRYTEREDLRQEYKFKTIAFRCMRDDLFEHHQHESRAKRSAEICQYDEETHSPDTGDNVWECFIRKHDAETAISRLAEILTPMQRKVVHLKGDGYCYQEIAVQIGSTSYCVKREMKAARETVKNRAIDLYGLVAA